MRIALAQLNLFVGDFPGNIRKIAGAMERAAEAGADLLALPELAVTGYPPEDLLHRADFLKANLEALSKVVAASRKYPRLVSAVGFVDVEGKNIYNAAALVSAGKVKGKYYKQLLPNYGVFDERRYFTADGRSPFFTVGGVTVAVTICEDLWRSSGAPVNAILRHQTDLVLNISASPYEAGKAKMRERMFSDRAARAGAYLAFVNMVGGQDELIFDGASMVFSPRGKLLARAEAFEEDFITLDLDGKAMRSERPGAGKPETSFVSGTSYSRRKSVPLRGVIRKAPSPPEEIYKALALGVKDYAAKNGFRGAVVGMSGGIDSALTALIAVDALGPGRVTGVSMPSRYTSDASVKDAGAVAQALGIPLLTMDIERTVSAYTETLKGHLDGAAGQLTRENLQARIRGALLMALSNRYGWLLLATGNKSEMSVGYATLYGDLAGGFAALKDVPKTSVYRIARWRNSRGRRVIPERVFTRPPTAELRPNQKDSDSLPPYDVLDPILKAYIEEEKPLSSIMRSGADAATVARVAEMVEASEYKRRLAPPGVKIQPKAFGKDRRVPISHGFRPGRRNQA